MKYDIVLLIFISVTILIRLPSPAQAVESSQSGNIRVHYPTPNGPVRSPLIIEGEARVFESNVQFRLRGPTGSVLTEGFTTASVPTAGRFGPFSVRQAFSSPASGHGTLEVFSASAESGAEIDKVTINVRFAGDGETAIRVPFHRMFNPRTHAHFYTANILERDNAINRFGYRNEGTAGAVFTVLAPDRTPLYRLFNARLRAHFYTANKVERDAAMNRLGYVFEGVAGFIAPQSAAGRQPLFRLYHPVFQTHFYTSSAAERNQAVSRFGYRSEGPAGFVSVTATVTEQTLSLFFIAIGDDGRLGKRIGCGDSVVAERIAVPQTITPLRESITRLLAIKNTEIGASRFYNALAQSDLSLQEATINQGNTALRLNGTLRLGGVCDAPRVKAQLEETAKQFQTVSTVSIFINGQPLDNFLSGQ